jgi:hypothetical protein
VRLLKDARDQMKAAAKATARDAGPGGEPADTPAEHRPVARRTWAMRAGSRAPETSWAQSSSALLASLTVSRPATAMATTRDPTAVPVPRVRKVHRNNYVIGLNKFGSVSLTYLNSDEHFPGTKEVCRVMQGSVLFLVVSVLHEP